MYSVYIDGSQIDYCQIMEEVISVSIVHEKKDFMDNGTGKNCQFIIGQGHTIQSYIGTLGSVSDNFLETGHR